MAGFVCGSTPMRSFSRVPLCSVNQLTTIGVTSRTASLTWPQLAGSQGYKVSVSDAWTRKEIGRARLTTMSMGDEEGGNPSETDSTVKVEKEAPLTELSRLEIRAGTILECSKHPEADTLYIESIDVGEAEPRTIVSGLVKFVSEEELTGRRVLVLCNLKPRAMRGVTSHGMLLCASSTDHTQVDPLSPPSEVDNGTIVTFEGHRLAPVAPGNRASKAFDRIAEDLRTNEEGLAMYQDVLFQTTAGPCFSPKKLVGQVS